MSDYADEVVSTYRLQAKEVTMILACIAERRDSIVRKIDTVRKMNGSIDDMLLDFLIESHQEDLSLIEMATINLKSCHFKEN